MFSALTDITDQIDPKFVISYWIPALVATFGGGMMWSMLTDFDFWDIWANSLDSVEQIVLAGSHGGLAHDPGVLFEGGETTGPHALHGHLLTPASGRMGDPPSNAGEGQRLPNDPGK